MQVEDDSHAIEIRNRPKRGQKLNLYEQRNLSVQLEEFAERINPTISFLHSDDQRDITPREKSENSKKVISREIVCF